MRRQSDLVFQLGSLLASSKCITTAESCTGGGLAEAITSIEGSSAWFEYGFITYSNRAKSKLLGVDPNILSSYGAVSKEVVELMALGALKVSAADIAVSISGFAGPEGGGKEKPAGTVWFAWACKNGEIRSERFHFAGDRASVRNQAVIQALVGAIELITSTR